MTTLREAAQRVFDFAKWINDEQAVVPSHLMIALRTALQTPPPPPEAQTDGEKNAYHYGWWAAMEAAREQRTEPEQEPVAHLDERIHGWPDCFVMKPDPPHTKALYTHPAPQPVELTDEEIAAISSECAASAYQWDDFAFARAVIEAYQRKQEGKV